MESPPEDTFLDLRKELYRLSKDGYWRHFVSIYRDNFMARGFRMNSLGDTPLHLAISNGAPGYIVEKLLYIIVSENREELEEILKTEDYHGNTPLHLAASMGSLKSCVTIAQASPLLLKCRNREGETPLFLAAIRGHTEIFLCLHHICGESPDVGPGISCLRNNSGETILHCAIQRESWELAYRIIKLNPELHDFVDQHGNQPLHLIANAPSAFISGSQLGFLNNIIYRLTHLDEYEEIDPAYLIERCDDKNFDEKTIEKFPNKYCYDFFKLPWTMSITIGKGHDKDTKTDEENPNAGSKARKKHLLSGIYRACFRSESIWRMKQKHAFAIEIMKDLIDRWHYGGMDPQLKSFEQDMIEHDEDRVSAYSPMHLFDEDPNCSDLGKKHQLDADTCDLCKKKGSNHPTDQKEKNERNNRRVKEWVKVPLLIAAKNGIVELVEEILKRMPLAIFDVDLEGKNIVLLAAEHKQPEVFNFLISHHFRDRMSLISKVDFRGNSALHLAAKLTDSNPWPVPGAASQMQWEFRWYKHIMQSMPRNFHYSRNKDGETPEEILWKTHAPLIVERRDWLGKTSEACSVVAGLLVTVTFPMSTTVPGGEGTTGAPFLADKSAFDIFAISSYVSFYSSLIAVVLFLSVLTSAYSKSGFHNNLPSKLLLGLTAFYVSIASTAISFSAGHYFILKDKLKSAAFPAYAGVCLLVIFFSIIEFPLYFQLAWAAFKRVPQRRSRMSRCWF